MDLFHSTLNIAEDRIGETENKSIKNIQNETQTEGKWKEQNVKGMWDMNRSPEKREERIYYRNNIFKNNGK